MSTTTTTITTITSNPQSKSQQINKEDNHQNEDVDMNKTQTQSQIKPNSVFSSFTSSPINQIESNRIKRRNVFVNEFIKYF
jgi:hypothetical protein